MGKIMADRKWKEISVDTNSDVWDREKDLEGIFVKMETGIGANNSKMYTIKTEEGEVKAWGSTVLDDKLANVPEGTYVKIEYEGKLKSKKGTDYHSFKVFIDESTQVAPTKDTVAEVVDGEPISLDQIPF
jgi:hypothetical protein